MNAGGADPNPLLLTPRLRLEPQGAGHATEMTAVLGDPRVHEFLPSSPTTEPELRERFARLESRRSPDGTQGWLNWVVFRREGGPALGTVQATVRPAEGEADVGYVFRPSAWGQGYGVEAVRALLAFLASVPGVREAARAGGHAQRRLHAVAHAAGLPADGLHAPRRRVPGRVE